MSISHSTPPPHPNHNQPTQLIRCVVCQTEGPLGKVLKCKQCHFRVHNGELECFSPVRAFRQMHFVTGICGTVVDHPESWKCEICENEETLEAAVVNIKFGQLNILTFSNSITILEPRLPSVPSLHEGREETKSLRVDLLIPVRSQAYRGARMGPRPMRSVHPRTDVHRLHTASAC
jgi:hypothetical protein